MKTILFLLLLISTFTMGIYHDNHVTSIGIGNVNIGFAMGIDTKGVFSSFHIADIFIGDKNE